MASYNFFLSSFSSSSVGGFWDYIPVATVRIKNNATICQICVPFFRTALLWFVQEAPGYGIAVLFAKRAAIRRTRRIFTAKGAKDCGALQDGALQRGHQSVALLPSKCSAFDGRK